MLFWNRKEYIKSNPYFTKENCPFCIINEEEKKLFLYETNYWKVIYNKFPYYSKKHLMAIPKRHVIYTTELNDNELIDYKNVENYMKNFYNDINYYSFIRQSTWWRSIEHLHYHYLPWHISFDESSQENIFKIKNK
jgi:diadenosine tetraphosphate (Ap4A) HIT family hydrolase